MVDFAKQKVKSFFKWKNKLKYRENNIKQEWFQKDLNESYFKYNNDPMQKNNINRIKADILTLQRDITMLGRTQHI